jgi:hypothetical protein
VKVEGSPRSFYPKNHTLPGEGIDFAWWTYELFAMRQLLASYAAFRK